MDNICAFLFDGGYCVLRDRETWVPLLGWHVAVFLAFAAGWWMAHRTHTK